MSTLASVVVLVLFVVGVTALCRWGLRNKRPPTSPDLRRADDAVTEMPSADETMERIGEAFGRTTPPGN